MLSIYIVIVHFNNEKATLACLQSLQEIKTTDNDIRIVVIDNGSAKKLTLDTKQFKKIPVVVLHNAENKGFSGGYNTGITYALENGAAYVAILNNDTTVHANFLLELLKTITSSEDIGIVTPKIYYAAGSEYHKERYKASELGKVIWYAGATMDMQNINGIHIGVDQVDHGQFDKQQDVEIGTGCCMLVKKEVFEKIGSFNQDYFLYYEDADFCMRAKKSGYHIVFSPRSVIWHENAASSGGSGSLLQDYYIARNRMVFGFTYGSLRTKIALIRESIKILLTGRKWMKKGIQDFYVHKLGKGSFR